MNYREVFAMHPDCSARVVENCDYTVDLKREADETVVGARLWTEQIPGENRTRVVGYIVVTTDGIDWFDRNGMGVRAQALHSID